MSWAAGRETRRPEGKAYSLLGKPMLYGKGNRAFTRLQEEIIRISDDHSLFAWSRFGDQEDQADSEKDNYALLARTPAAFAGCANIVYIPNRTETYPYSINNRGIAIRLRLIPWSVDVYLALINCLRQPKLQGSGEQQSDPLQLGLFLKWELEHDKFFRVSFHGKDLHEFPSTTTFDPWRFKEWYHEIMNVVPSEFRDHHTPKSKTTTEWDTVPLQAKRDPWSPNAPSPGAVLQTMNGFKIGPRLLEQCENNWATWESSPDSPSQWTFLQRITMPALKVLPGPMRDAPGQFTHETVSLNGTLHNR